MSRMFGIWEKQGQRGGRGKEERDAKTGRTAQIVLIGVDGRR